jgi:hypothetical protein
LQEVSKQTNLLLLFVFLDAKLVARNQRGRVLLTLDEKARVVLLYPSATAADLDPLLARVLIGAGSGVTRQRASMTARHLENNSRDTNWRDVSMLTRVNGSRKPF